MKKTLLILALAAAGTARAQWQTTTYTLKGGWNAIHLTGDAAWDTMEGMMPGNVEEVWRWNPNPTQAQFTESPLIPSAGTPDWSVWRRGQTTGNTLLRLTGQSSYLVKCSGTASTTHTVHLKQTVRLPQNTWVRSGANLVGFPTLQNGAASPLMSAWFSTFPVATAANTRIYKYAGGDLGPANPVQVFSPALERMDRTKAYWFSAEVTGTFYAPIEVSAGGGEGLAFGRSGTALTARFRNRTSAPVTLTFTPLDSELPPAGQPAVTAAVPLTRRTQNTATLLWESAPVSGPFTQVIGPQAGIDVHLGVDRAAPVMTGAPVGAVFASFLRVTDSGNLMDIYLPASAAKTSLTGLWVGDAVLKQAGHTTPGAGATPRELPLRFILHVATDGTARLLPKVFLGPLAAGSHEVGLCTQESLLQQDAKASAQRLVSAHLPLNPNFTISTGSVAIGSTLRRKISVAFNDPANPFVHKFHPDHDNKDPRGNPLPAGKESYTIARDCSFTFTAAPPAGESAAGWGATVIGGDYSEELTGLHRQPITVRGTFTLRRVSEDGTLHQ